jgi:hypothetical protein
VPEQEFVRRCPPTAALKSALSEYADFAATLKKRGLEIQEQAGDGNCLFRAVSLQVYGDPSMHADIRKKCMDFMVRSLPNVWSMISLPNFCCSHPLFRSVTRIILHHG